MSNIDLVKHLTGKTVEDLIRVPTLQEVTDRHKRIILGAGGREGEVLTVGRGTDGPALLTAGEREDHLHIIGAPGEGKSKFLEWLIRNDIDRLASGDPRACGLCFIDPSAMGGTVKKILAYCAEIGFKKVLYIDPYLYRTHGKITPINPINYHQSQIDDSISSLMDAFRVVFNVKAEDTNIIQLYLPALLGLIHYAGLTFGDSLYFTDYDDFKYMVHREHIFDKVSSVHRADKDRITMEAAFKNEVRYKDFGSTMRRLMTLFRSEVMTLMFSHRQGIDFQKLISKGWVLLVNVCPGQGLDVLQSRLLSTIIINEIIAAIERLRHQIGKDGKAFNIPYYLYIDEAGTYATEKIAEVLELKMQIGLRMILSHQFPGQFDDPRIRQSVENMTKLKAAFYIANATERKKVIELLNYGGVIETKDVNFALAGQKKQHMVWRAGKNPPQVVRVPDVPDSKGGVKAFIDELLKGSDYITKAQVDADYAGRIQLSSANTKSAYAKQAARRKASSKNTVPPGVSNKSQQGVQSGGKKPGKNGGQPPIVI